MRGTVQVWTSAAALPVLGVSNPGRFSSSEEYFRLGRGR